MHLSRSKHGGYCCDLHLLAHVVLAHVALVYTVWTLTGVLNSLAHPVMSITTFTALSETIILDIPLLPLALASETQHLIPKSGWTMASSSPILSAPVSGSPGSSSLPTQQEIQELLGTSPVPFATAAPSAAMAPPRSTGVSLPFGLQTPPQAGLLGNTTGPAAASASAAEAMSGLQEGEVNTSSPQPSESSSCGRKWRPCRESSGTTCVP